MSSSCSERPLNMPALLTRIVAKLRLAVPVLRPRDVQVVVVDAVPALAQLDASRLPDLVKHVSRDDAGAFLAEAAGDCGAEPVGAPHAGDDRATRSPSGRAYASDP